jgi:hypothetical protein
MCKDVYRGAEMVIELEDCTRVLLTEIACKEAKRNDIAKTYRMALASSWPTDWKTVNQAIMDRWSFSGLEYIKNRAWNQVEGG